MPLVAALVVVVQVVAADGVEAVGGRGDALEDFGVPARDLVVLNALLVALPVFDVAEEHSFGGGGCCGR